MPKGYVIGHIRVRDPERYRDYIAADTPVVERHGGRFIIRGGQAEVVEGETLDRHVVVEFESYQAARAFYHDPDYQAAAAIRQESAESVMILVEGAE